MVEVIARHGAAAVFAGSWAWDAAGSFGWAGALILAGSLLGKGGVAAVRAGLDGAGSWITWLGLGISPWLDVDRPEDLDRLERLIHEARIDAPATAKALGALHRKPLTPVGSPRISVVIPTLDQAARIGQRLSEDGLPEVPLMEDLELARRLRRQGRIRTVPASVTVSGRWFEARPVFYTVLVNAFPLLHRLGVSPARLARLHGAPR